MTEAKVQYKIETVNGVYTIRRPMGRYGAKHFALLAKCVPSQVDAEGKPKFSEDDKNKISEVFEVWAQQVLPGLIIDGPFKYDQMPGEDQYGIFIAMLSVVDIGSDLFRIVE